MSEGSIYKRLEFGHCFKPFDCGDDDLNEFCIKDSFNYLRQLLSVTYYIESSTDTVLYFSLSNDKVSAIETNLSFWRRIKKIFPHEKHRKDYPAVKIGRFAVNMKYQHTDDHWGSVTLDYIKEWMVLDNKTGCRFITVDAYYTAVEFYKRNGFVFMGSEEEKRYTAKSEGTFAMMFDLKNIATSNL